MSLSFDEGWAVTEDSTGELRAAPVEDPDSAVLFWQDVYPLERRERIQPVSNAAAGLLAWLRANPNLRLSKPAAGSVGSDVRATVVDISIAANATNEDPGCPVAVCLELFGFRDWDAPYGIGGTDTRRLYLSDVEYGGTPHLLVTVVEGATREDLDSFLPSAERLIATVQVPLDRD